MRVGFIGLGKLGMPCAVAAALKGHDVMGYDLDPKRMSKEAYPSMETGPDGLQDFAPYLEKSNLEFGSLEEVVDHAEILFVAVQTPHEPRYEGVTPLPEERKDFDYTYLKKAVAAVGAAAKQPTATVIISTVLPGTIRREILPVAGPNLRICYNPFFIAMGTTMRDFLFPEFVLFGVEDQEATALARQFYAPITEAPFFDTTVENAELIKVSYNTYIGMKIVFANTVMEICHKTPGTDVDQVVDCLELATRRLISPSYMRGGMGDGGGCHPRDNIALSWLARELDLSYDFFDSLMIARQEQTEWLADLMCSYALPKRIIGYAYKPGTEITTGSPALLLGELLKNRGVDVAMSDPVIDGQAADYSNEERLPSF